MSVQEIDRKIIQMIESDILLDALLGAGKYGKMAEQQAAYFGFDNPRKDSQHSKITEKKLLIFLDLLPGLPKEKHLNKLRDIQKNMIPPFGLELGAFIDKHTLLNSVPEKHDTKIVKKI